LLAQRPFFGATDRQQEELPMRLNLATLGALALLLACGSSGSGSGSPPTVVSTSPASGATGVALAAVATVTFSAAMDCSTLTSTTFGESLSGVNVTGGVICNGSSATFAPSVLLEPSATYTATVQAGVKDTNGNALAASYSWSFTTAAGTSSPPTVVSTSPVNGATGVPVSAVSTVTFSQTMDCTTLVASTFGESFGGVSIAGSVTCTGASATFTPLDALEPNATYTAAVHAGVKDTNGNALAATYSWSFTTAPSSNSCAAGTDSGKIYVADFVNDRIVRMDDMCGTNWTTLGATGTAVGDFGGEQDVFVDTNGQIYVADTFNNRIVRMDDMSGTNWTVLGTTPGTGTNQFMTPRSIFVRNGHIYVTDGFDYPRIVQMDDMTGTNWTTYPPNETSTSPFKTAWGLFVDAAGHIYVTDSDRGGGNSFSRIVRMDDITGANFTAYGTFGNGTGQFEGVWGISVDSTGHIYIADFDNARIVRIDDMTGANWTTVGTFGVGTGQFFAPAGLFVDATGRIYVADYGGSAGYGADNHIVRMDDMTGANWTTLGTLGAGLKEFTSPTAVWLH
jgi:sugar lactone lactonase YvrE